VQRSLRIMHLRWCYTSTVYELTRSRRHTALICVQPADGLAAPRWLRRVPSHCHFRNRGTEYDRDSGKKWMSGSTKRQCDRALCLRRHRRRPSTHGVPPRQECNHSVRSSSNRGCHKYVNIKTRINDLSRRDPGITIRFAARRCLFSNFKSYIQNAPHHGTTR
jgi:hypothetical protein